MNLTEKHLRAIDSISYERKEYGHAGKQTEKAAKECAKISIEFAIDEMKKCTSMDELRERIAHLINQLSEP